MWTNVRLFYGVLKLEILRAVKLYRVLHAPTERTLPSVTRALVHRAGLVTLEVEPRSIPGAPNAPLHSTQAVMVIPPALLVGIALMKMMPTFANATQDIRMMEVALLPVGIPTAA